MIILFYILTYYVNVIKNLLNSTKSKYLIYALLRHLIDLSHWNPDSVFCKR